MPKYIKFLKSNHDFDNVVLNVVSVWAHMYN